MQLSADMLSPPAKVVLCDNDGDDDNDDDDDNDNDDDDDNKGG